MVVAFAEGGAPTCPACAYPGADARQAVPSGWEDADAGWSTPADPALAQPVRTSGKAVTSMVLGIAGIVVYPLSFILGIIALVLGIVARKEIQASGGALGGNGMAVAGVVLGVIGTVLGFVVLAAIVFVLVSDLGTAGSVAVAAAGSGP